LCTIAIITAVAIATKVASFRYRHFQGRLEQMSQPRSHSPILIIQYRQGEPHWQSSDGSVRADDAEKTALVSFVG
jgi:hypothetical protein